MTENTIGDDDLREIGARYRLESNTGRASEVFSLKRGIKSIIISSIGKFQKDSELMNDMHIRHKCQILPTGHKSNSWGGEVLPRHFLDTSGQFKVK